MLNVKKWNQNEIAYKEAIRNITVIHFDLNELDSILCLLFWSFLYAIDFLSKYTR